MILIADSTLLVYSEGMRYLLSWTLYWLGDITHRVFVRRDLPGAYVTYNKLMIWSDDIQGSGPGPWTRTLGGTIILKE